MVNKKIGLCLAGGGLQGYSHIGVLKALEELNINIECISGTSTGGVIASLYALGFTPTEIEQICKKFYKEIFKLKKSIFLKMITNFTFKKQTKIKGLIDGNKISEFINNLASKKNIKTIQDVKIKLALETVDTKTMKECIFISENLEKITDKSSNIIYINNISLGDAARASMSFPGIITPLDYKQYNFIDGGTINNLPTKILKQMGAEFIISSSFDLNKYIPSNNMEDVITRALDIFSHKSVLDGRNLSDVSIEIYNKNTGLISVKSISKTIENGYNETMAQKEKILKMCK